MERSSSELYDFADEAAWSTSRLHEQLGNLSLFFTNVSWDTERTMDKLREANHIAFELQQRGEPWLLPRDSVIVPKRGKRKGTPPLTTRNEIYAAYNSIHG